MSSETQKKSVSESSTLQAWDKDPSLLAQKYEFIVNQLQEMVTVINRDYCYVMASDVYLQNRGKKRGEIVNHSVGELWGEDIFQTIIKSHLDQCFTGRQVHDEAWIAFPDQSLHFFDVLYCPYRDHEGKVTHAVVFSRDISDKKKTEEQLVQAQKMEIIGRLTAGIAHDFNNALTVISGYAELRLLKLEPIDPLRRDVELILAAVRRAENLAEQLLTFSRQRKSKLQVVDVNTVLQDLHKILWHLMGVQFELVIVPDSRPAYVKLDTIHLEQVIMNLAANARDAMGEEGKLILEIKNVSLTEDFTSKHEGAKAGEYAMVAATDTGCGMTEEVKKKIFEPFFTTKEKEKGKGTGLGLSTCWNIVHQYKGCIEVESEPGRGTTFRVYFPHSEELPSLETQAAVKKMPRGTETVILVENEGAVRDLSRRVLTEQGYKVLNAANGQEALRLEGSCRNEPIHLVITNFSLPKMGGRELVKVLRQHRPSIRILFTSGSSEEAASEEGPMDAHTECLQKPYWPASLAVKVRELLDR